MSHYSNEDAVKVLIDMLPKPIAAWIRSYDGINAELLEIAMDLGREPEMRFSDSYDILDGYIITAKDIQGFIHKVNKPFINNRAGVEGTLHRISAIRDRSDNIIGLTIRLGRVIETVNMIADLLNESKSVLIMGAPGAGKTTRLRQCCKQLSSDMGLRVVIVDTSNEIGGESIVPHPAVGRSRRMMVSDKKHQADIMVEAVENHYPEVVVIDEIGTYQEAMSAQAIAERGVILLATAHGCTLENLVRNTPLKPLIGNIKSVTISDTTAKKAGTQKTILERETKPAFDCLVEIVSFTEINIYHDLAKSVDAILRGDKCQPEVRIFENGVVRVEREEVLSTSEPQK